jgi:hypothetical protein
MSNTYGIPEEDEKEVRARDKHLLRVFSVPDHRGDLNRSMQHHLI